MTTQQSSRGGQNADPDAERTRLNDERATAQAAGDTARVTELDAQIAQLDNNRCPPPNVRAPDLVARGSCHGRTPVRGANTGSNGPNPRPWDDWWRDRDRFGH